jgi:amino acid ABC superfamily ATP binding cassette transporter, binding protein
MKARKWGDMKQLMKKVAAGFLASTMLAMALTACGGKEQSSTSTAGTSETETQSEAQGEKTLVVGVAGTPKPYNYVEEDGSLAGYEIDMLNEMAKRLGYTLEYEVTEFESMFAGLDSGRYNLIIGNISKKPEREEKYLFSTKPYFKNKIVLITAPDNTDIQSIDDLGGKRVPAGSGRANALFMESYNEQNPNNQIDIQYTDADASEALIDLHNGRYDACIYNQTYVTNVNEEYGYEFNVYEIPNADEIEIPEAWILYSKSETDLQAEFDQALEEIKADGTLSDLSVTYFGDDYVPVD